MVNCKPPIDGAARVVYKGAMTPAVTNHAIQRYLERVCGIDMRPVWKDMRKRGYERQHLPDYLKVELGFDLHALRASILPKTVREIVVACGGTAAVKHRGHKYVVMDHVLVTIVPGG